MIDNIINLENERYINFYKENVNILIYVANIVEFNTTLSYLKKVNKKVVSFLENGNCYYVGKIGLYPVILVKGGSIGQSNINSSEPTINKTLKSFVNIKYIITVGVCGGASSKVELGDVIIANEIVDYESQKILDDEVIDRSQGLFPTQLGNILSSLVGTMQFEEFNVHYGKVISGNKLVNSNIYADELKNIHKEILALDMEGYSISRATITNKLNDWIFIKSTSDHLQNKDGSQGQEKCVKHSLAVLEKILNTPGIFEITKIKILISGSYIFADDQTKEVEELSYKLTQKLIDSNYKIISGYGKCVGNAVVAGAYNSHSHLLNQHNSLQDFIEIYPFPKVENKKIVECLENIKYENRKIMSKSSSFTIFIYGKKDNGELAPGMNDEFRLATRSFVIPVGSTGYKSKELWNIVNESYEDYYQNDPLIKEKFISLNNSSTDTKEIINSIIEFINAIKNYYFDFN